MPNRLANETSPYLRQHADNPVDWNPWDAEALARARAEQRPIFLSIGYAACHWCHVMERESFADEETAAFLNEHFVSIKVDREERPDLDAIYMDAVVALTGQGGWPMSVFLTPDGVPFFGGTYFPKEPRYGMPTFRQVLEAIAAAWRDERDRVLAGAAQLAAALRRPQTSRDEAARRAAGSTATDEPAAGETSAAAAAAAATAAAAGARATDALRPELLEKARDYLSRAFDRRGGGFGAAPKFPQPMALEFLLRSAADGDDEETLRIVTHSLDTMARGGIHDQLGGGFHRYSVDGRWLVPHFEKMLYDNAQLATVYLHAWQVTGSELYRRVATRTLDYVLREMTDRTVDADGRELAGFFSSQDADSRNAAGELEEGAYYTWTPAEIAAALMDGGTAADGTGAHPGDAAAHGEGSAADGPVSSADVRLFGEAYGVTQHGDVEGRTVLHEAADPDVLGARYGLTVEAVEKRLEAMRRRLFAVRERRAAPARDDKVVTAWNGLMLAAFAEAARVLGRDDYRRAAEANAAFLLENLRDARGRLLRTWRCVGPGDTVPDGAGERAGERAGTRDCGIAKLNGYLDDYADVAYGLLQLYQTTFDERWFVTARQLADTALAHFADPAGGFFATSDDHEELLRRPRSEEDNAVPSGGAMLTLVLVQLAAYTGDDRYAAAAEAALVRMADDAATMPLGFAQWLVALDLYLAPPVEVAIVGEQPPALTVTTDDAHDAASRDAPLLAVVRAAFRPHLVVAAARHAAPDDGRASAVPLLEGRRPVDGRPAAYVCRRFACAAPVTSADELEAALRA